MGLELPDKGFTKQERAWLKQLLVDLKSAQAVAGANVHVTPGDDGQIISADDCDCALCT